MSRIIVAGDSGGQCLCLPWGMAALEERQLGHFWLQHHLASVPKHVFST